MNNAVVKASRRFSPAQTAMALSVLTMLLLSGARVLGDAKGLTGSGAFGGALGLAVPVGLAGLGGLLSERVGIVNIGLQGMLVLGTWGAGFFGWKFGPWGALLGGAFMGALGGALHALTTITFGVEQAVSGVAINLLAPGVARFLPACCSTPVKDSPTEDHSPIHRPSEISASSRCPSSPAAVLEAGELPIH